jgi:dipeptidyl aminopeptidase/acylaminoacyl peptidase
MDLTQSPTSLRGHIVLRLLLGGDQSDIPARYRQASPITHITPTAPPFLLLHGAQDPLVPPRQSQRMAAALQAAHVPVTLHIYADLGHELPDLSTPIGRDLLARMQGWLERWLPARAPTARLPAPPR